MRLRLDKLVLSAGLALAMVATAVPVVPVGAATTAGYYVGTTSKTDKYVGTLVQDSYLSSTTSGNFTITAKSQGDGAETATNVVLGNTAAAKLTVYEDDNSLTSTTQVNVPSKVTASQDFTYALTSLTVATGSDTNGTAAGSDSTANPAVPAVQTTRNAAVAELVEELNDLGIGTFTAGTPVTATPGTGSYTVPVTYAVPDEATTDYGTINYSNATLVTNGLTINVSPVNSTTKTATISCAPFTLTKTHTITDLSEVGATYKIVSTVTAATGNDSKQYSLLQVTKDGAVKELATSLGSAKEDVELTADVTDLTSAYYLASKTVSVKDKLIFDDTDTKTLATIEQKTAPTVDDAKTKFASYVEANSVTTASYFTITLKSGLTSSESAITFKIAVPTDVEEGVTYTVLRYHDGKVEALPTTVANGYITFESDLFSDFALVYGAAAAETPAETPATDATVDTPAATVAEATTTAEAATTATATTKSPKTADNSMMPIVVVSLLLALCAGSVAIYEEKKTY